MLRTDFVEFLQAFYQCEALLKYALQIQMAAIFVEGEAEGKARDKVVKMILEDFQK